MRKFVTAAELIGLIVALLIIVYGKLSGISTGITVFVAILTGLSLWVAFWVYHEPFRSEQAVFWTVLSAVCFGLVLSITGLVTQSLEFERDQRFLIYLFFMSGVSVGVAAGVISAYLKMARKQ